jgi:hypothetical protein
MFLLAACMPVLVACTGPVADRLPDVTARALDERAASSCRDRPCIYVMSYRGVAWQGFVTMYPVGATGNVAPIATIFGPDTDLDTATSIALDSAHNIYVTNGRGESVTVYAAGATGNVAPIRKISGRKTGLNFPVGVGLDASGAVYVANSGATSNTRWSITVYAPGATGDVAPIRTIKGHATELFDPQALAVAASGTIYVLTSDKTGYPQINVYAAGANGDARPIRTIGGAATGLDIGVLDDAVAKGRLYLAQPGSRRRTGGSISVFDADANGNVPPERVVTGPHTRFRTPAGVAVGTSGEMYVTNAFGGRTQRGSVTVYAPGANGAVKPTGMITGSATELYRPSAVTVR